MNLELRKIYIRHRENYPETEVQYYAWLGFHNYGTETVPFYGFGDIQNIDDLGPEVGICGYIGDVHEALRKINKPIPENVDYPKELKEYLGRNISISTLEEVRKHPGKSMFIKPLEHKLFTGFVWNGSFEAERRLAGLLGSTKVYVSEPKNILSEYRCFVLDGEILDCRKYKGDWSLTPYKHDVNLTVSIMKNYSRAFCLDFGVLDTGETILVEMNEGYAFGHYGLRPDLFARMISARWSEMAK